MLKRGQLDEADKKKFQTSQLLQTMLKQNLAKRKTRSPAIILGEYASVKDFIKPANQLINTIKTLSSVPYDEESNGEFDDSEKRRSRSGSPTTHLKTIDQAKDASIVVPEGTLGNGGKSQATLQTKTEDELMQEELEKLENLLLDDAILKPA